MKKIIYLNVNINNCMKCKFYLSRICDTTLDVSFCKKQKLPESDLLKALDKNIFNIIKIEILTHYHKTCNARCFYSESLGTEKRTCKLFYKDLKIKQYIKPDIADGALKVIIDHDFNNIYFRCKECLEAEFLLKNGIYK